MNIHIFQKLGPGILMASAAVGVSHLVQSTRAGVYYGLSAIIIVLLANILKYPFYEYAHRYAASTGNNLLDGYKKLGRFYLWSFLIANSFTSVGAITVVSLVTAALVQYVLFPEYSIANIALGIMLLCWIILLIGHYRWLEFSSKILMLLLCISTFVAATAGWLAYDPTKIIINDQMLSIISLESLPFIIALMGWMPASSEVAVWQSLWVQAEGRSRGRAVLLKDARFDFNVGYIMLALLACLFIAIGSFTLQGQGMSDIPSEFAGQFITMYTSLIGSWSYPVVASTAIITMFSTIFTLMDAYPRSLSTSIVTLFPQYTHKEHKLRHGLTAIIIITAYLLLGQYADSLKLLIDLVTIFASLAMPYFAWLNMRCIKTIIDQPPKWIKSLAIIGLVYLLCFTSLYLYSRM